MFPFAGCRADRAISPVTPARGELKLSARMSLNELDAGTEAPTTRRVLLPLRRTVSCVIEDHVPEGEFGFPCLTKMVKSLLVYPPVLPGRRVLRPLRHRLLL